MRGRFTHRAVLAILLICQLSVCLGKEAPKANKSKYLDAVRQFADNVLKYGRDTYGPKHTPLFVDGLNIHTHEPVKWIAPNGDRWILCNFACQQNLLRTLDGLTKITGDPKYKQAAMDAIEYAFGDLRSPNGLLHWGGHQAYDVGADNPCGRWTHENKGFYPHYELMWEVNPTATRQFIESFWSGHIRDWSNLDMDRHCYEMNKSLEEAWKHEYKGGPVFFEPKQGASGSFLSTAGALVHGAAALTKLSGDGEPLMWAKRLVYRYVQTRDPETDIGAGIYTGKQTEMPTLQEMKDLNFNVLGSDSCFPTPPTFGNSDMRRCWYGYCTVSPGIPFNGLVSPWICAFFVGKMMGSEGKEFIQWSVEELTAWGKVAYRKSDNSWIPMLRDGTSLEGLVVKKDGPFGPEGTEVEPVPVIPMDFWAYALAYRLTENDFMWRMAGSIALGSGFGDIGATFGDLTELKRNIDCADPYALVGFLELYKKTQYKPFLGCAKQIGDNILTSRFHKGFFAPSGRHFYARFDSPESLALLHLHAVSMSSHAEVPTMWPSQAFFEHAYRDKDPWDDNSLIYRLTRLPEPPISLQEAAARGNLDLIMSLIENGIEVDSREDSFFKTALHRAAMSGHRDVVEYLLAKGAQVDAWNGFPGGTPLDYAAEKGHKEVTELLIAEGANLNAKRGYPAGDTPLHSAAKAGHTDTAELLIANGADVNAKNNEGLTPVDIALSQNRKEVVGLLIEKGADVSSIHLAAHLGDAAKVMNFIEQGSDVNTKDQRGLTPLHYAARQGHKEIVELLLANGADVNSEGRGNRTAAEFAMQGNHNEVVELLVSKGADISPLHMALYMKDEAKARSLIEGGADVNRRTPYGTTPLYRAIDAGFKDIVELLIAKGANVNAKDNWDWTPLHSAVYSNKDMVEMLIAKGADINTRDGAGLTPLWYAKDKGHDEIVELLRKHGAKE